LEPAVSLHCFQETLPIPIPNQMKPVHNLPNYFFKIRSDIIFPSTSRSSELYLPFRFCDH